MKKPDNMTPQELRDHHGQFSTPLEIGIRECWMDWLKAAGEIDNRINWGDFFDGCFMPLVDAYRVVLCINREAYYPLVHETWVSGVLEAAILKVMRIPFYVELTSTETD